MNNQANLPISGIPALPENAPFTEEQRYWLNGYLAGLLGQSGRPREGDKFLSHTVSNSGAALDPASEIQVPPPRVLPILYGSQSGNAEALAYELKNKLQGSCEAANLPVRPQVFSLETYQEVDFPSLSEAVFLCSTWGDGEFPDNAKAFAAWLQSDAVPRLEGMQFAVIGLGDSNYTRFCGAAAALDQRLRELGAVPMVEFTKCDSDYESTFDTWSDRLLNFATENWQAPEKAASKEMIKALPEISIEKSQSGKEAHGRKNPYPAVLLENRPLNGEGSRKDTRHLNFSLAGSGLDYRPGDAVGVWPKNDPSLVTMLCDLLNYTGSETVVFGRDERLPILACLLERADLHKIPLALVRYGAEHNFLPSFLLDMLPNEVQLAAYLRERDLLDLIMECPQFRPAPQELAGLVSPLSPRLYSIASSSSENPEEVQLTVGVVSTHLRDRIRKGACSTYLAERVAMGDRVRLYIHPNRGFHLPDNGDSPLIMVGPGTGIAPFRAYLRERRALGQKGPNWLFFGDQHRSHDFLYREELEAMREEGLLYRLDLAFSRDQDEKIYVQHLMLQNGAELFRWLQEGAHFRVCGDAKRMASDVEQALLTVIRNEGCMTMEASVLFLENMRKKGLYVRDVY